MKFLQSILSSPPKMWFIPPESHLQIWLYLQSYSQNCRKESTDQWLPIHDTRSSGSILYFSFWVLNFCTLKSSQVTRLENRIGKKITDNSLHLLLQKRWKKVTWPVRISEEALATRRKPCQCFTTSMFLGDVPAIFTGLLPQCFNLIISNQVKESPPSRVLRSTIKWKTWVCALNHMENQSDTELCNLSNCINGCSQVPLLLMGPLCFL